MQVKTISDVSKYEARRRFLEYRDAIGPSKNRVGERGTVEDRTIMAGYRAISLGRQVTDVHQSIRDAGVDHQGRPKLAICRADVRVCWYQHANWRRPIFAIARHMLADTKPKYGRVTLPVNCLPWLCAEPIRAIVPSIPPRLRPKFGLHNYHILWEADWEKPPVDPMLLKHIMGPLYAVLATWDLTELERAVIAMRANN